MKGAEEAETKQNNSLELPRSGRVRKQITFMAPPSQCSPKVEISIRSQLSRHLVWPNCQSNRWQNALDDARGLERVGEASENRETKKWTRTENWRGRFPRACVGLKISNSAVWKTGEAAALRYDVMRICMRIRTAGTAFETAFTEAVRRQRLV